MKSETFLLFSLTLVCRAQIFQRLFSERAVKDTNNFRDTYDFIVIGAGSGGSVVANRLTENPNWTVLLLEAGQDEIFLTDIPLMASIQTITSYNWGYKSVKLKSACLGLVDGKCNMPRGKALGGTSVINFLLYTRGNRKDFDQWGETNPGWSYSEVFPYFLKSENCSLCREIDGSYHGFDGYLNVEHPGYESPIIKSFIKSGSDFGYRNNDPNGEFGLGFSKVLATMKNGARCSASKAFLKPILDRTNLHISIRTRVTRILINPETGSAFGVEFIKNRKKYVIRIRKEVILSAGAINSPFLLMHSGIGPSRDLQRVGIPVIKDLKVGYNLQDHMAMSTLAFFVNQSVTVSDIGLQNPVDIFNYLVNGKGPFTIPGGAVALAFIQTKYAQIHDYPDIELVLGAGALNGDIYGSLRSLLGIPKSLYDQVYARFSRQPAFGIAPVLMRPKSRGRVLLKDADPLHWPVLVPNYFERIEDVRVMTEGIKMAISIAMSRHFAQYNTTLNPIPFPQCKHYEFGSDPYWECAIRQVATTLGHQVGTCKMGPSSDPEAVVDHQLKVHGIENLRVVDGSIMPNIVAGHTNAPILMIGEKASDMIKNDWLNK